MQVVGKLVLAWFIVFAQFVSAGPCINSFDQIKNAQFVNGTATAISTSERQVFILCPNTEFKVGYILPDGSIGAGQTPLALRSNMTILCGKDGKSSNNCNITTGDIGFYTVQGSFGTDEVTIDNAVLSGITFSDSIRSTYFLIGGMGGNIDIIDCRFYVRNYRGWKGR
jgi:hypothetical protein